MISTECAAGEYLDTDGQTCFKCGVNTYSTAGQNTCTNCATGFTTSGATGASVCGKSQCFVFGIMFSL